MYTGEEHDTGSLQVNQRWLKHLQDRQLGEEGHPRKTKIEEDPHRVGLSLEWVFGMIVSTAEKARDGAHRCISSQPPNAQHALDMFIKCLHEQKLQENRQKMYRQLLADMLESRKNARTLLAQYAHLLPDGYIKQNSVADKVGKREGVKQEQGKEGDVSNTASNAVAGHANGMDDSAHAYDENKSDGGAQTVDEDAKDGGQVQKQIGGLVDGSSTNVTNLDTTNGKLQNGVEAVEDSCVPMDVDDGEADLKLPFSVVLELLRREKLLTQVKLQSLTFDMQQADKELGSIRT